MAELKPYALRIDGPLLANQRQSLLKVLGAVSRTEPYTPQTKEDADLLQGIVALLDEIADQAHDRHGIESLLASEAELGS